MSRECFLVVLPARYGSTRFPGKPLVTIAGKPLIEWAYRRAREINGVGELVVATDDRRIAEAVERFGGKVAMTSGDHATGTDRVAEVARSLPYDYVVNLQGDEPVFDPRTVEAMVDNLDESPQTDIVTACHPIDSPDDYYSPNVVKVVLDRTGRALYFSRSPIPSGAVIGHSGAPAYRHVGVYAYRKEALLRFTALEPTTLEKSERLEQLRALEFGMTIRVIQATTPTFGVDVPEDVKKVEKELARIYTDRD
ncbi:MAG: 3-deoxy-manno-octulosonate cytidylyltransferase [Candidatus Krumholzibacteria bacterium]|nr:3-deoxy-manno-octulosonate cytidylyltransferase [Candidatus Krumholzibacteria bacterium]MCK5618549.1 3-deoxy-manno-octulosonate cytidylyltransferase [Candidatus Krumholzibacteria bacterium]